jgi:glutathione synthase/RimK-type ligase-like ATP-grasp enzyme/thioredoxin-like negative regulator of GroEL
VIEKAMPEIIDTSAKLRAQAMSHHRAGNLAAAISTYESLLEDEPDDADCLGLLAMALHQSGRLEAARGKLLASQKQSAEPYIHLRNLNNFLAAALATGAAPDAAAWALIASPRWPVSRIPQDADKEMIVSAARGLMKIGKRAEALRLIADAAPFAGGDLTMARNFADMWIEAGQPEKAHQLLTNLPDDLGGRKGEILLARAAAASAVGLAEEAARLTSAATAALPVHLMAAQPGQQFVIGVMTPLRGVVTQIMSAQLFHFARNSPGSLAWNYSDLYRFWSVFPEAPGAVAAVKGMPRPDLVLNNWVNAERLLMPDMLEKVAGFADRLGVPVLNHPRGAAQATRQRNAERLAGIPGLVVPRVARLRYEPRVRQQLVHAIGKSFGFPVIVRDTFSQMGKEAGKFDSAEALETYLADTSPREIYAIQFINNPIASHFYRKIRAAVIGDEVIISHVHFGERWNVHRERDAAAAAGLQLPAAEEAFARSILFKPEETLGAQATAALHEIKARIPLDFYGIDFDVLPDGQLVFFEANAAMTISLAGRKSKGVEPIRVRMREALHRLFTRTSGRA